MRKLLTMAALCLVGALVFAPAAMAQDPCPDPDFPRYTPDGCQASDLPDVAVPGVPPSSPDPASATATPTASASASASASAAPVEDLPETGGASVLALGAGALLVVGGLVARRIVR